MDNIEVCSKTYTIIKLLGHGKGGYSYLAKEGDSLVVLKQIHHEPCDYYKFGNKIEAEINDYKRLRSAGIRIPKMLLVDKEKEIIIKEYIEGKTIFEMIKADKPVDRFLIEVREMANLAKMNGINIDYFPTNFIPSSNTLFYIDYECNDYIEEWNFENWGIKYWSKTKEFLDYLKSNND